MVFAVRRSSEGCDPSGLEMVTKRKMRWDGAVNNNNRTVSVCRKRTVYLTRGDCWSLMITRIMRDPCKVVRLHKVRLSATRAALGGRRGR